MAQLSGVKTISSTEIEYGGKRYVKTEGFGEPGDIVRSDWDYSYLPQGTFYLVGAEGSFADLDGDVYEVDTEMDDEITLFRKVTGKDGRKAEVINRGRVYTTYKRFAEKHGYPDAAVNSDSTDSRKAMKNGDIVTLLTRGTHENPSWGTLWIVETAEGERFIINEGGLRILPSTSEIIAQKRTELAALTAEITALETQLAEEQALKVGDWARVVSRTYNEEFHHGDIVRVITVDSSDIPYQVESAGGMTDWACSTSLEKITPADARAALIASIDELFGGEEAVASAA
ncbi:hypothetical protein [Paenibacillus tuaregi]|uniref:hypothetical protein n=1 Tax=Paenibacillus tuaregi TaxID=1816681 RepID=UPI000838343C|nr:hypothetical protein [Paenibacillus tuaregi]